MASETQIHSQPRAAKLTQEAKREVRPLRAFFTKFSNDWSMTFAGALAYSLLTAMLPIVIAIVAVLGFILGGSNSQQMLTQITKVLPGGINPNDPNVIHAMKQVTNGAGFLALIAIVLAVFGGSRLFIAIEGFMSIIYRVRPRKMLRQNLIAIGMMVIFIFLTPMMVLASTLPNILITAVANNHELAKIPFLEAAVNNLFITYIVSFLGGLLAAFILFEAIYFIVPNQRISWHSSWHGALTAGIALEVFLIIFPTYTRYFMSNYVGQIGFAIVLLAFFYYFAVILILGAEVNAFFFEGVQPIPNDLATFVSTMAGKLNKDQPNVESPSHVDSKQTDLADKAHVASARTQEAQIQQTNSQKQATTLTTKQDTKQDKKASAKPAHAKKPGKAKTILEVAAGSTLAMVLELFRMRQQKK